MGTVLGVVFIVVAAVTGVYVGTRPTVMDGRWIAAKISKSFKDKDVALECQREIPVGVRGAEFACTQSSRGGRQEVRYRMLRDGTCEQTAPIPVEYSPRARRTRGED